MTESPVRRFPGRDGVELAYRELGDGRPLVLLHGFTADGSQWIHPGPAATIAAQGYRVILPDLRGHGESARPHDPASYPSDVLADDGLALVEWLGLDNYDLGGYSLGARIVLRMLVRGARPAHATLAGQGLDAINRVPRHDSQHRRVLTALANGDSFEPGSPDAEAAYWINQLGGDPRALLRVLDTHVATPEAALSQITTPVLVAVGDQDHGQATADALAATLPNACFTRVPGDHFTALTSPQFATAIKTFSGNHRETTEQNRRRSYSATRTTIGPRSIVSTFQSQICGRCRPVVLWMSGVELSEVLGVQVEVSGTGGVDDRLRSARARDRDHPW